MRDATSITAGMTASGDPEVMGGLSLGLGGISDARPPNGPAPAPLRGGAFTNASCTIARARRIARRSSTDTLPQGCVRAPSAAKG